MTATAIVAATTPTTYGNSLGQLKGSSDSYPRYDLGAPTANDIFNFQLFFTSSTTTAPNNFFIRIVDQTFTSIGAANQPATFEVSTSILPALFFSYTWTVPTLTATNIYVEVYEEDTTTGHPLSF